jgi:hypothetical protein
MLNKAKKWFMPELRQEKLLKRCLAPNNILSKIVLYIKMKDIC